MLGSLLVVHGTGVRHGPYMRMLATIRDEAGEHLAGLEVVGCFWGDRFGARLNADGVSVPGYEAPSEPSEGDRLVALWSILLTDPWYELRLLGAIPPAVVSRPPNRQSPAEELRALVFSYAPPRDTVRGLRAAGLADDFDAALGALRDSEVLVDAAATAPDDLGGHPAAVARALVAWALVAAQDRGEAAVDGTTREAMVDLVARDLGGATRGVGDWVGKTLTGLGARMATPVLVGHRSGLTFGSTPFIGDILRFLARGDGLRRFVAQAIAAAPRPVTVLGHSLGGIVVLDLLLRPDPPTVDRLITVGSQGPMLFEMGALPALDHDQNLDGVQLPAWLNVYDRRDLLSYLAAPIFGEGVVDVEVDNGQPFPQAHSAYWSNPNFWSHIKEFLA